METKDDMAIESWLFCIWDQNWAFERAILESNR